MQGGFRIHIAMGAILHNETTQRGVPPFLFFRGKVPLYNPFTSRVWILGSGSFSYAAYTRRRQLGDVNPDLLGFPVQPTWAFHNIVGLGGGGNPPHAKSSF